MAHFAEVNSSNEVLRVVVISNTDVDANGGDQHADAETFVTNLLGHEGTGVAWKQLLLTITLENNMQEKGILMILLKIYLLV